MLKLALTMAAVSLLPVSASAGREKLPKDLTTARQVRALGDAPSSPGNNGHCRLQGVVTLAPNPEGLNYDFYLQDSTGGILMRATRLWSIGVGDTVEVSGLIRSPRSVTVQNVIRLHGGATLSPRSLSLEEALRGDGFGELVTVPGALRKRGDAILVGPEPSLRTFVRNRYENAALLRNVQD